MKKRFTEEQIIGVLKEGEAGLKPAELCRKHGISEATYYIYGLLSKANGIDEHGSRLRTYIRRQGIAQR
ncbi:transposase, partial [Paraburkholderia lycopersici]